MTSVTQRMTASREARKHRGGHVQRTFSPLTPIIQRLYSAKNDEVCACACVCMYKICVCVSIYVCQHVCVYKMSVCVCVCSEKEIRCNILCDIYVQDSKGSERIKSQRQTE